MKKKSGKKININFKKIALISLHVFIIVSVGYLTYALFKSKAIGSLLEVYLPSKYLVSLLAIVFFATLLLLVNALRVQKRKILVGILATFMVLTSGAMMYATSYVTSIEDAVQQAGKTTRDEIDIVFIANEGSDVNELKNIKVGLLSNTSSNEGYIAPMEYLSTKTNIEEDYTYATWHDLMLALAEEKVDAIVLPASYKTTFEEDSAFMQYGEKFVEIDKYTMKIETEAKTITDTNKPFNILLVGTDSPLNGTTSGYLFDVVIIATVDPSTGSIVLTSVPRDSLLYSSCIGGYDKITHNGSYGIECLSQTLENAFNTSIDYHMIIGFAGIIDIVDYLGGVTITNPYGDVMLQDSSRKEGTVSVPAGTNLLDGQQTLAFARNRSKSTTGVEIDANVRSSNHTIVLKAILTRITEVGIASDLDGLINIVAKSTITNFPINDLASISKIGTSLLKNNVSIKAITLQGIGVTYPSPAMGNMPLYGYLPYQESVNYISDYINMVYNGKYVAIDASMNLSTGAPKVEAITSTNYAGGYSGGTTTTTPTATPDPVTPEPVTPDPVEPDPVTPVEPDPVTPVEPDPVTPVEPDPVTPPTSNGT